MPRNKRKLWTPTKAKAAKPQRTLGKPKSSSPKAAASAPSRRVLADLTKLKPIREEHGWRFEDFEPQRRNGRMEVGERWTCDYVQPDGATGCKSFVWRTKPEPGQYHAWNCPYWHLEGKNEQPF